MINGSNLLKSAVLAASLAVLPGTGAMASSDAAPKAEQCLDPEICPIPYVRLTKQETEPFLFQGKVVDEKHPWVNDYRKALRRFPNVRSCLKADEREKAQPDLRQIDWEAINDVREIEVCVFRIASSIERVGTIKVWLKYQGFTTGELERTRSKSYTPKRETDPIFQLQSQLSIEKFRQIIRRSWLTRTLGLELGRGYDLYIDFSQNGQVAAVFSWLASKLNT